MFDPVLLRRWRQAALHEARRLPAPDLSAWLALQLERHSDPAFGESFAAHIALPDRAPADYLHRVCPLPRLGRCLLGIRFRGGDRDWPFVDLLCWEHPLHPATDDLTSVVEAIAAAFAAFRPRAVRLLLAEAPAATPGAEADLLWVSGDLGALERASPPPLPPGLRQRRGGSGDAAAVAAAYAELPEALRPHLSPAGADDLAPPTVAVVIEEVGGGLVALAAARPAQSWALSGHEVLEEVVAPGWRGRGLGAAVQRALIAALPAEGGALFGTIHHDNTPSRRTARRCGRAAVAAYWMLPITDR